MQYPNIKVEKHSWYISSKLIVTEEPVSIEEKREQVEHNKALLSDRILAGSFVTFEEATQKSKEFDQEVEIWQAG